jgi:VWFA-related protein
MALLFLVTAGGPQDKALQYDVRVVNIEVPVRVFSGDSFVGGLTLDDFELLEDGVPQRLEALYVVRNAALERKEDSRSFNPDLSRHFYLFFICYEYTPKIKDAVSYFVEKILRAGDRLVVVTPRTTYDMRKEILGAVPRAAIATKLLGIIRRDILAGDAAYRTALNDLKRSVASRNDVEKAMGFVFEGWEDLSDGDEAFMMKYRADLKQLEELRTLDEDKLFEFSDALKSQTGRKYVYLFYQREFVPVLDKSILSRIDNNIRLRFMVSELMELYHREVTVDVDRLRKAYADSSITIHFLYLTTRPEDMPATQSEEHSEDIFIPFAKMAEATGGLTTSSSNAAYMMEQASTVSENYYLLYYSPLNKTDDGKFREIQVRIKKGAYKVTHRAGYFAK